MLDLFIGAFSVKHGLFSWVDSGNFSGLTGIILSSNLLLLYTALTIGGLESYRAALKGGTRLFAVVPATVGALSLVAAVAEMLFSGF